jgi:HPt (histidine-containing phosphotransfer) domain-containing protein
MKYVNLNYLKELSRNNNAFVVKIINGFMDQVSDAIPDMEQQVAGKDWEGLYSLLHRLKPSLEIMGVHALKSTIVAIEDSISTETNMNSIYESIEKIKDTLKDVVVELEVEKEKLTNELSFHKKELQV